MTRRAADILKEAMSLSERNRGDLAARLIDSLHPATDEALSAAWSVEIARRIDDLRDGKVEAIPG